MSEWPSSERVLEAVGAMAPAEALRHDLGALWAFIHHQRDGLEALPVALRSAAYDGAVNSVDRDMLICRVAPLLGNNDLVIKGAGVARHYPARWLRTSSDLDILTPYPARLHAVLQEQLGARPLLSEAAYAGQAHHHLPPLGLSGFALHIEVHGRLGLEPWMRHPPLSYLVERSRELDADLGTRTLDDADHAVYLAAHHWHSTRLTRRRDLVDIALLASAGGAAECAAAAEAFGVSRLWRLGLDVISHVILGKRTTRRIVASRYSDPTGHELLPVSQRYLTTVSVAGPVAAGQLAMRDMARMFSASDDREALMRSARRRKIGALRRSTKLSRRVPHRRSVESRLSPERRSPTSAPQSRGLDEQGPPC